MAERVAVPGNKLFSALYEAAYAAWLRWEAPESWRGEPSSPAPSLCDALAAVGEARASVSGKLGKRPHVPSRLLVDALDRVAALPAEELGELVEWLDGFPEREANREQSSSEGASRAAEAEE